MQKNMIGLHLFLCEKLSLNHNLSNSVKVPRHFLLWTLPPLNTMSLIILSMLNITSWCQEIWTIMTGQKLAFQLSLNPIVAA
jgi:hypothetical protein